jgi:MOSC domain-containing protein YiiM
MTSTDVDHVPHHRDADQLAAGLEHVRLSPADEGSVQMLVIRPAVLEREVLDRVEISETSGVVGDTWDQRPSRRTPDGGPNPAAQVTVMNSRAVDLVAGDRDRWPLAGDQIYVDLDLGLDNLPTGTLLRLGGAVLEVTDAPHTGCAQFSERFGVDALRLTATPEGKAMRLRGINTRVVLGGQVAVGDAVAVERPGA